MNFDINMIKELLKNSKIQWRGHIFVRMQQGEISISDVLNCIMCKSTLSVGNVNHIVDFNGHIIIIKEVPANICNQCGEYFLENEIALKLERIIEEAKKNNAEIFVINYAEMAA